MICAKQNVTPTVKMITSRVTLRAFSAKDSTELAQRQKEDAEALLRVERFRKYQQKSSKFLFCSFEIISSVNFLYMLSLVSSYY